MVEEMTRSQRRAQFKARSSYRCRSPSQHILNLSYHSDDPQRPDDTQDSRCVEEQLSAEPVEDP